MNIEIDSNVVTENLVELLTNSLNMTAAFYDIFLNETPMDVTFWQYNNENTLEPITIPNRAKDRKIALEGQGTPEGKVKGAIGTAYVDTTSSIVYFKVAGSDDMYGWAPILTRESVVPIIRNYLINKGYITSGEFITYLTNNNYITASQTATINEVGVVSVDGTTITSDSGKISAQAILDQNAENGIKKIWTGTQESFDLISPKDFGTIYILNDTGKIYLGQEEIVSMSFVSLNTFDEISPFPTNNVEVTPGPQSNGIFYVTATSNASGQYLKVTRYYADTTHNNYQEQVFTTYASAASQLLTLSVPIMKGDKVKVDCTAATTGVCGFYKSTAIG